MRDSMRKGDFEHSNEESNGNSSDEEENQLPMSGRKGDAENLNGKEKKQEEDIGRRKCRTKSPIDKYNEEVRGWTYSSKNLKRPPDLKKTKEENRLEKSKRKKNEPPLNGMIKICRPS